MRAFYLKRFGKVKITLDLHAQVAPKQPPSVPLFLLLHHKTPTNSHSN